jgi:predicted ester cyclase
MVRFGICTEDQYFRVVQDQRIALPHVAYNLLDVGERPTERQIRAFEDISMLLRTSNGTFRTTFPKRFLDVDEASLRLMQRTFAADAEIRVQDRAVSHGLTSWEWAQRVFPAFPNARFEASDILAELYEVARGGTAYIVEPNGRALQFIKRPFVVSLEHDEPKRFPVNRLVALWAKRRFDRMAGGKDWMSAAEARHWRVRRIPYVHPRVREMARGNERFRFRVMSVFEIEPQPCAVIRTMNIFNESYFSDEQLAKGAAAVFQSLQPGGIWIVGRTLEEDLSNHATFLRRAERGWEVAERIGRGSEMERIALGAGS